MDWSFGIFGRKCNSDAWYDLLWKDHFFIAHSRSPPKPHWRPGWSVENPAWFVLPTPLLLLHSLQTWDPPATVFSSPDSPRVQYFNAFRIGLPNDAARITIRTADQVILRNRSLESTLFVQHDLDEETSPFSIREASIDYRQKEADFGWHAKLFVRDVPLPLTIRAIEGQKKTGIGLGGDVLVAVSDKVQVGGDLHLLLGVDDGDSFSPNVSASVGGRYKPLESIEITTLFDVHGEGRIRVQGTLPRGTLQLNAFHCPLLQQETTRATISFQDSFRLDLSAIDSSLKRVRTKYRLDVGTDGRLFGASQFSFDPLAIILTLKAVVIPVTSEWKIGFEIDTNFTGIKNLIF